MKIFIVGNETRSIFKEISKIQPDFDDLVVFAHGFYKKQSTKYIINKFRKISNIFEGLFSVCCIEDNTVLLLFSKGEYLGKFVYKEKNCICFNNLVFILDDNFVYYKCFDKKIPKDQTFVFVSKENFFETVFDYNTLLDRKICFIDKKDSFFVHNNIKIAKKNKNITQYNVH